VAKGAVKQEVKIGVVKAAVLYYEKNKNEKRTQLVITRNERRNFPNHRRAGRKEGKTKSSHIPSKEGKRAPYHGRGKEPATKKSSKKIGWTDKDKWNI